MKKLGIILLALAFVVGATSLSLSGYENTELQKDNSSEGSEVKSSSEKSKLFDVCDKINDLYESGELEDMLLASYPKHLNESLVIDFDNDGVDEEIRYFEFDGYADIGQYVDDKRFMLWYHKNLNEDHNGSNIIRLDGRYLVLMSFSMLSGKQFNPYKVSEVTGMTIEKMRGLGFTDEEIQSSGFSPTTPSYKVLPICLRDGSKLKVWKRTP